MKFIILSIFFLFYSSFIFAFEQVCVGEIGIGVGDFAQETTKTCTPEDVAKLKGLPQPPLASYYGQDSSTICECLNSAKFNEARVSSSRKKQFIQSEYDKTIREKLAYSFRDLVGNFTKFSNLLAEKDAVGNMIPDSFKTCDLKTVVADVSLSKSQYLILKKS